MWVILNLCMQANLSCFCCCLMTFLQNELLKKNYFKKSNGLDSNCFQRLSGVWTTKFPPGKEGVKGPFTANVNRVF